MHAPTESMKTAAIGNDWLVCDDYLMSVISTPMFYSSWHSFSSSDKLSLKMKGCNRLLQDASGEKADITPFQLVTVSILSSVGLFSNFFSTNAQETVVPYQIYNQIIFFFNAKSALCNCPWHCWWWGIILDLEDKWVLPSPGLNFWYASDVVLSYLHNDKRSKPVTKNVDNKGISADHEYSQAINNR